MDEIADGSVLYGKELPSDLEGVISLINENRFQFETGCHQSNILTDKIKG
jgi:hypothetical protein